ncbi:MAG: methyl-accepting chemotaxis protein [Myxococcota bacterium]|nr:methyl-accepting chemotaxis protein [Myxococcota bacterium]
MGLRGKRFRSLRWRINLILATGTGVIALATTLAIAWFLADQLSQGLEMKAKALATLLSANLVAAIDFDDKDTAKETLAGLLQDEDFTYAVVLKTDNTTFVEFGSAPQHISNVQAKQQALSVHEAQQQISVAQPILREGENIGTLKLFFSLKLIQKKRTQVIRTGVTACLLICVVLTVYFALAMNRTVIRPMQRMIGFIQRIGNGDLSQGALPSQGRSETLEITQMRTALNDTAAAFRDNVKSIQQTAGEVASIAENVMASASLVTKSATMQVQEIEEAGTTTKEVDLTSRTTTKNAESILDVAQQSVDISQEGLRAVKDSIFQFREVSEQVKSIVSAMGELEKRLNEVDIIVASVSNVAEQSQLLAINAAIEASQAKSVGPGFEVIAREIKTLSIQSKEATKSVRMTLGDIKDGIKHISEMVLDSHQRTETSMKSSESSGQVIDRLALAINSTAEAATRISRSLAEQVVGLNGLTTAVNNIENSAQDNLRAVREIEAQGESLNGKSSEMEKAVSRFYLG